MTRQEWEKRKGPGGSLGRTLRERGRVFFQSCTAGMKQNPKDPNGPWIPWISPGIRYNIGRNKAKREKAS